MFITIQNLHQATFTIFLASVSASSINILCALSLNSFLFVYFTGQASKLDRLNTTGRFGLGFNSVFHWTDCPSIVSGDFLVMLDRKSVIPYIYFHNRILLISRIIIFNQPMKNMCQARQPQVSYIDSYSIIGF